MTVVNFSVNALKSQAMVKNEVMPAVDLETHLRHKSTGRQQETSKGGTLLIN
jgi:hypothetical protein